MSFAMTQLIGLLQKLPPLALLMLSACSTITGDFFAKYWSTNRKVSFFFLALLAYSFSGLFFTPTLLKKGLVLSSLIWSLASIIGLLVIGLIIFHESLSLPQIIGVSLGIIALIVLNI